MPRPIRASIDLEALRHNYLLARHKAGSARALAVVKANAYGPGIGRAIQALGGVADGFALLEAVKSQNGGPEVILLTGTHAHDMSSAIRALRLGAHDFLTKPPSGPDEVIVAVDRGSGRRAGWLSNYHLAVVDGDGFADVGKTFKGFTDQEFIAMTERLWALAVADDGYTVRVRPEIVVEVEFNEIQKSPTYPSGLALRFARISRVRDDKGPGQATTLGELRALYEAQFHRKGRAG